MLLNDYLKAYLSYYQKLSIKGLGVFHWHHEPAVFDSIHYTLSPPFAKITFNPDAIVNTDEFFFYINQHEQKGFDVIQQQIEDDVSYIWEVVREGNKYTLEIGDLVLVNNDLMFYSSYHANNNPTTFGLQNLQLKYASHDT